MSKNPYKDYYDAISSGGEWAYVDAEKASKRIKELEEIASLNNCSVESLLEEPREGMGY